MNAIVSGEIKSTNLSQIINKLIISSPLPTLQEYKIGNWYSIKRLALHNLTKYCFQ